MSKLLSFVFAVSFVALPLAVRADSQQDVFDMLRFMNTRTAAILSGFDSSKPSCVMTVSTTHVRVHEKFVLAWGAFGIDTSNALNTWPQNGATYIAIDAPGTYRYKYTYYGANGAETSCSRDVVASAN